MRRMRAALAVAAVVAVGGVARAERRAAALRRGDRARGQGRIRRGRRRARAARPRAARRLVRARRALRSRRRRRGAPVRSGARAPLLRGGRDASTRRAAWRAARRTRAEFLARSLDHRRRAAARLRRRSSAAPRRPRAESLAHMEALLQQVARLRARRSRALLARPAARRGAPLRRGDRAASPSSSAVSRRASGRCAPRRRAPTLLLSRGHPFVARPLYRELASVERSGRALGRQEGMSRLGELHRCAAIGIVVCVLYLVVFAWLHLRAVLPRARLRRVPLELLYYAPVAVLFVAAAITENRAIGLATSGIAVGGAALVWLTSLGFASRLDRGPMSAAARIGRVAAVLLRRRRARLPRGAGDRANGYRDRDVPIGSRAGLIRRAAPSPGRACCWSRRRSSASSAHLAGKRPRSASKRTRSTRKKTRRPACALK